MPAGPPARPSHRPGPASALAWGVLALLLGAALLAAATLDRRDWGGLIGDEAAYLMQAESLAFDGDLVYERGDYDRFVDHWGRRPEGLILQSGDRGETVTYGKPALYSAWLAPFVRLSPTRGAATANALLLALAAVAAARALRPAVGAAAPLWVAAFVFASVAFANVFWAHGDLFLMCLTALGLALVYRGGRRPPAESPAPHAAAAEGGTAPVLAHGRTDFAAGWRWALAGALLAAVALARPPYAPLLLAAAWAAWGRPAGPLRRRALAALAGGALACAALAVGASAVQRGSWTPYGGERMGFYSHTGFPEVDLPPGGWSGELARRPGSGSWVAREKLVFTARPKLLAYDALYFAAGGHVGVLPYYLPGLLGLLAWRPGSRRWPLAAAVAATVLVFFVLRPFNFYGGGEALANRYFLPVYPALWFLAAPGLASRWRRWTWLAPLAAALAAAPFLLPLWTAPRAHPRTAEGAWRYVSPAARRLLPYETTLDHLKPAGRDDFAVEGLWVKPLTPGAGGPDARGRLVVEPAPDGGPPAAELLLGSPHALAALVVEPAPGAPPLSFGGAELLERPAGGGRSYRLAPRRVARHPMWWTADDYHLYRLRIESGGPAPAGALRLRLKPEVAAE